MPESAMPHSRRIGTLQNSELMVDPRAKSDWPAYRVLGVGSMLLTAVGFAGLCLMKQIRDFQGIGERELMQTQIGSAAIGLFASCFVVGLMVMFPISLYLQKRAGVPLPGPRLPSWIAWLVKAIIVLVIGFMLWLWTTAVAIWLFRQ